jgi:long-chain acyl-CoA synthetase
MFLKDIHLVSDNIAAIDDNARQITYGELELFSNEFHSVIGHRCLIFILSENSIGSLAGYVATLENKVVPLILSCQTNSGLLASLLSHYEPQYIWLPTGVNYAFNFEVVFEAYGYALLRTSFDTFELHQDLALLLPTSGSTGSPKLVRHSYQNILENAKNVAQVFNLTASERAIVILPMHYTMGLSIVASHLFVGATLLVIKSNLTDASFWKFIKDQRATSFTGVPYSYEVLAKLRFFRMDLPDLKILSQGGGRLDNVLFQQFAEFAKSSDKKFIATYGQTEGTARMAYLKPELAISKVGSIGNAIPNGNFQLVDEEGNVINDIEGSGQLIYQGPNVTLGYAICKDDLKKGDENNGVLYTGDIAFRDTDGCYFITGRKSRFLKLYGSRISLDEIEQMIRSQFGAECVCKGTDSKMEIYLTNLDVKEAVSDFIVERTGLFHKAFEIILIDEIKRNEAGKIIF